MEGDYRRRQMIAGTPETRGRAITSTSERRRREGERSLRQANAGNGNKDGQTLDERMPNRGQRTDRRWTSGCRTEDERSLQQANAGDKRRAIASTSERWRQETSDRFNKRTPETRGQAITS